MRNKKDEERYYGAMVWVIETVVAIAGTGLIYMTNHIWPYDLVWFGVFLVLMAAGSAASALMLLLLKTKYPEID